MKSKCSSTPLLIFFCLIFDFVGFCSLFGCINGGLSYFCGIMNQLVEGLWWGRFWMELGLGFHVEICKFLVQVLIMA